MEWQCERLAKDHSPIRAEITLLALLNLARIEGNAPLIDRCRQQALELIQVCYRIERLLSLDSLHDRLNLLQAELTKEANRDLFRQAIINSRADSDRFFRAFDRGESSLVTYLGQWKFQRGLPIEARAWMYRPHMAADWAEALDFATQSLALADLPEHQRRTAFAILVGPPRDDLHIVSAGCASLTQRVLDDLLRAKAYVCCTVAALAVERYRLLTGEWPTTLESIPKTILPSVPLDPMTGKPILFARRTDGVTVYAVGPDGFDDGGKIDRLSPSSTGGVDLGIRLYNPDQRRLPALHVAEESEE